MSAVKDFTVIIPLRAGSKGMPNKNITELDGKPLYMHAVDLARKSGAARIIITTDISLTIKYRTPNIR